MVRTLVATGVFAAASFAGVAAAPAASADLCQTATVDTIATNPVTVNECVPYSGAPQCVWADPSFLPWYSTFVQVCVPAP